MASWLDILGQDYSDSKGRLNPFALGRGFTKQGRSEIDERQMLAHAQRQQQTVGAQQDTMDAPVLHELMRNQAKFQGESLGRSQSAIAGIGPEGPDFTKTPRTPEEASMFSQMMKPGQEFQTMGIQKAQEGRESEKFGAERPFLGTFAQQRGDANQEAIDTARQARLFAGQNQPGALEQQGLLTEKMRQEGKIDPRIMELIKAGSAAGAAWDPKMGKALLDAVASQLGDVGKPYLNSTAAPGEDPNKAAMAESLRKVMEERSRRGGSSEAPQAGQSEGMGKPSENIMDYANKNAGFFEKPTNKGAAGNDVPLSNRDFRNQDEAHSWGTNTLNRLRNVQAGTRPDMQRPEVQGRINELMQQLYPEANNPVVQGFGDSSGMSEEKLKAIMDMLRSSGLLPNSNSQ